MLLEITLQGEIINEWPVFGQDPWERFSGKTDYRKVSTTKPHQCHPNYVFKIGKDIWATRCLQKDAICLTKAKLRINTGDEFVHDGVVFNGSIYFTQVTGHITVVNIHNHEVQHMHNLNKMIKTNLPLGWCRGIKVLDHDKVIVGFTRKRPIRKRDGDGNEIWEGEYGVLPTIIACFDLKNEKQLWEQQLEDYGMNAIYSIHSENESIL